MGRLAILLPAMVAIATLADHLQDGAHSHLVGPYNMDVEVDCSMRALTLAYALAMQPERSPMVEVFDALRLSIDCNMTRPDTVSGGAKPVTWWTVKDRRGGTNSSKSNVQGNLHRDRAFAATYFVDSLHGKDDNDGTASSPFATLARGQAAARAGAKPAQLQLRDSAPFYLSAPLRLSVEDSGLSISAFPGEAPVLSGGAPLVSLNWRSVGEARQSGATGETMTEWTADLRQHNPHVSLPFDTLVFSGRRAVRARYPNGNPEESISPNGWTRAAAWRPPFTPPNNLVQQNPKITSATRSVCPPTSCEPDGPHGGGPPWAIFCCFFWGWNATATNWTTGSFWGANPGPPGGGTARMPGGLIAGNDTLPRLAAWTNIPSIIVHAFHDSYWGDWAYELQSINATSGHIDFAKGGFQEARGSGSGDLLYYENILEELDDAGEWYLDSTAATLYYMVNGTDAPPADGFVATQLDNIISIIGNMSDPVNGVELSGLTFRDTRTTFMSPFTVPSGGDWSFHDGGAVRISGVQNVTVQACLFTCIGGTGVMISGYARDTLVSHNEFVWLGESAITSAGLNGDSQDNSDGNYPARSVIQFNYAHELGLYVKQTGFYYQGMSANTSVIGNVFFNGPRAGINVNDGFAGGHDISSNVGFNLVRETSDHGVFNSWDRNTYLSQPGMLDTRPILMDRNLFICNYKAYFPIDNDDGSNSYVQTRNFLLWGGAKNLMGYNKAFLGNAFVYVDYTPVLSPAVQSLHLPLGNHSSKYGSGVGNGYSVCAASIAPYPFAAQGMADQFRNNTCIASSSGNFFNWYNPCNSSNPTDGTMWLMSGNKYMSTTGDYTNACNHSTWNLTEAQERGVDVGSSATTLPSVPELEQLAHALLGF